MHRRALALTAILAGATLTACGSGPEKTKEPPKKSRTVVKDRVSPADKDEVENHIFKLSNPNRRETPRDALVELARGREVVRDYIHDRLVTEYDASVRGRGVTGSRLTPEGRVRAVFILGKTAMDLPERAKTVRAALEDPDPMVRLTAAEVYAERNDETVLPLLVKASETLTERTTDRFVSALSKFAAPKHREAFLKALTFSNLDELAPLVEKTIKPGEKNVVINRLLSRSELPAAQAWAIRDLVKRKQKSRLKTIRALAPKASPELRKEIFKAQFELARSPAETREAIAFYKGELQRDPADAEVIADFLRRLGSVEAIEALGAVVESRDRSLRTRKAALGPISTLREKSSPRDQDRARLISAALPSVRAVLRGGGELARLAVQTLGKLGDPVSDTDRLVEMFSRDSARRDFGQDLVDALGRLGDSSSGSSALIHLVRVLKRHDDLRAAAVKVLSKKPAGRLPLFELVDLLRDSNLAVRDAAYKVLNATTGKGFGYRAAAEPAVRNDAADKWEDHVRKISGG